VKAALYVRISQDRTGQQAGVTRQTEDCQELAATLGWEVVEVYTDNDKSATSGKIRPAYRRMLADLDVGKVNAIISWHPDRLYRVVPELGELVEVCKRNNVQIATVRAGIVDLTTPSGRLVAGLLAQVATYEGEAKADRWKRAVRQNREAGHFPPSRARMFGYTRDGQIVPEEAEHVRWMADEITQGRSLHGIVRELCDLGVTTAAGAPWRTRSLKHLVTNPKTTGYVVLNGDIIGEGNWTPLLDRDTWETVRAILAVNGGTPQRPRVSLLPGLIYCGTCGTKMVTGSRMGRREQKVRTYRCPFPDTRAVGSCGGVSGIARPIEEVVEAYTQARWDDAKLQKRVAELRGQPPKVLVELAEYEARVIELEQQLDVPGVPVAAIVRAIDRAKERVGELSAQLSTLTPVKYDAGTPWPEDLARRRALVEVVVERVTLMPATARSASFDVERVKIKRRDLG
jgi:site-specific DNA recombinase